MKINASGIHQVTTTKKHNVLVFPCGTEIGLEIHAALQFDKTVQLFGASSVPDHGECVYKNYISNLPYADDPALLTELNKVIEKLEIDFVIAAHDQAIYCLSQARDKLRATLLASPAETCEICRYKSKIYELFSDTTFCPKVFDPYQASVPLPVFLKPDCGQGSVGTLLASDEETLVSATNQNQGLVGCEYLPGAEYTVDCYTNQNGVLMFSAPRSRERVKSGISVRSQSMPITQEILDIASTINEKLTFHGPWFFQLKEDAVGRLKLLEVAPRVAGTMATHRVQGINFVLMALYEALGHPVTIGMNRSDVVSERAFTNRFLNIPEFDAVYMDFDDTLTLDEKVNIQAMQLIYQCRDKNIPVILITRHHQDPRITLESIALHAGLFSEIVWISDGTPKSKYMEKFAHPILFDDSHQERQDAFSNGYQSFGPDCIEAFIDWRR